MMATLMSAKQLLALARKDKGTVLAILAIQLEEYRAKYECDPQLIVMHRKLKPTLVREVYEAFGWKPEETVIEPIWIGNIPMIFVKLEEDYIQLRNNTTRQHLSL
jgi:sulfite reductase alpha subunit-like flavoprotein